MMQPIRTTMALCLLLAVASAPCARGAENDAATQSVAAAAAPTTTPAVVAAALPTAVPPVGKTFVVLASGVLNDTNEQQTADAALSTLKGMLTGANIEQRMLVDIKSGLLKQAQWTATRIAINSAISSVASAATTNDRVLFYYIGQANVIGNQLRLNLRGEDVTGADLVEGLGRIKAGTLVVVLDCPSAGIMAAPLSGGNRIIICAARADQTYATKFSEFFLPAFARAASDTDKNGRVSLLEAFTAAARGLEAYYEDLGQLRTETPVLEDDADGVPTEQPWRFKIEGKDGAAASQWFLPSGKLTSAPSAP